MAILSEIEKYTFAWKKGYIMDFWTLEEYVMLGREFPDLLTNCVQQSDSKDLYFKRLWSIILIYYYDLFEFHWN